MMEAIIDIPLPGQRISLPRGRRKGRSGKRCGAAFFGRAGKSSGRSGRSQRYSKQKPNGYNPIVLYGPSGTGKSHLALGMATEWKTRNRRRVECIAAVDFARELNDSIETQAVEEFRTKYRQVGFLVFEDIGRLVNQHIGKTERPRRVCPYVGRVDRPRLVGNRDIVHCAGAMTGMLPALQSRLDCRADRAACSARTDHKIGDHQSPGRVAEDRPVGSGRPNAGRRIFAEPCRN